MVVRLSQPVPVLRILDEAAARRFYVDFLGFTIDWEHRFDPAAPLYLQISRDGCVIHLSAHSGDCSPGGAIRIDAEDVHGLMRELLHRKYDDARPVVESTPWRTQEMSMTDPFGNRLIFVQPASATAEALPNGGLALSPVGLTALWVAASRALESENAEPLYRDPYARMLAGDTGFAILRTMLAAMGLPGHSDANPYLTIRTRYFDDTLLAAVRAGSLGQVVILAAGLDARAFRLDWPPGVVLFEVDRDDIFGYKEPILTAAGAEPRCHRRIVRADLSAPWVGALSAAGFDPGSPAAFLVEGLLVYLEEPAAAGLLQSIRKIAAPGSWLGLELPNAAMLTSPLTAPSARKLAAAGCPWRFGVDDAEGFLGRHGWTATVESPGDPDVSHGRWPFPSMPRREPGMPANYLVQAR